MKPRSREINIFNLSMLDVIAGALGAFLILFLVLAPHYGMTSTSTSDGSADAQERKRAIGMSYVAGWERRHVDVDLWVQLDDDNWRGPKGKLLFDRIRPVYETADEPGTRQDTTWWEHYRRIDSVDGIYLFAYAAGASAAGAAPAKDESRRTPGDARAPVAGVEVRGTLVVEHGADNRSYFTIAPVRFEQPREVRIAALMRVSGGAVEIREFGETWAGGELPPRVAKALAEFRARQSAPTK